MLRQLGSGGMGAVYLVEHRVLRSLAAVKVMHPHLLADPDGLQRFMTEAEAVSRLNHPGIITIFDIGTTVGGQPWFAMEYVAGTTVEAELAAGAFAIDRVIHLVGQLAAALDRAHLQGVVHRDLKPANVMLTRFGSLELVKVVDFGIAKLRDNQRHRTVDGALIGTPDYMAPEQISGGTVDERTDVYALGAMTWELLVGAPPFGKRSVSQVLAAHLEERPAAPAAARPELPPALSAAVEKALAKRPDERFSTAGAFAEALRQSYEAPVSSRATPLPIAPRSRRARLVLGDERYTVTCQEESTAGCFVVGTHAPPVLAAVTLFAEELGESSAEVVRRVDADEAALWGRPVGFFLQFRRLTPRQHLLLDGGGTEADLRAEERLAHWRSRFWSHAYAVLDVPLDAAMPTLARAFATLDEELSELEDSALSPARRREVAAARARLTDVWATLGSPAQRARYDASIANWRGIAACLRAGLSTDELTALRDEFLRAAPDAAHRSRALAQRSFAALSGDRLDEARTQLLAALAIDPLNEVFHQTWRILEDAR